MSKNNPKNRSMLFLAATLLTGIAIIAVLLFFENNDVTSDEITDKPHDTNFKELESKIDGLRNQNFNPTSYNTLVSEIDASFKTDLINGAAKNNLMLKLCDVYSDLVFSQADLYLAKDLGNAADVAAYLNQIERITSGNKRIKYFKEQLRWHNYYSNTLPAKIKVFLARGVGGFDLDEYVNLKEELQSMPNLDPVYKNSMKFRTLVRDLTNELQELNNLYYQIP